MILTSRTSPTMAIMPALCFVAIGMSLPLLPLNFGSRLIGSIVVCIMLLGLSLAFIKYEKSSLSSVNFTFELATIRRYFLGFLLGSIIAGGMILAVFTMTDLHLQANQEQSWLGLLFASIVIIPLALFEGLLFRGYAFFRLKQLLPIRYVIWGSALLFGINHLNGENSIYSVLMGPGVWGITFAVAAYLSNSLALPLGMHMAANFLQAIVGLKSYISPMWIVNRVPEAPAIIEVETLGILMQIVLLVSSVAILELSLWRKRQLH